jgi:hypothetical protein
MLHKTADLSVSSDYSSSFPEQATFNNAGNLNISVNGNGLIKGTSGLRWWDSSVVSPGTITGAAGSTLVLPFTRQFFAPYYLDLIATVTIDGTPYVYATSNHPDNSVQTSSSLNVDLFYLELCCMGKGVVNGTVSVVGSNTTNNHFMQGGAPRTGNDAAALPVRFPVPAVSAGTLSIAATYYSYDGDAPTATYTKTVAYVAGATSIPCLSPLELYNFFNGLTPNYKTPWYAGYYKIIVTSSVPSSRSLLKAYHWGIG